MGYSPSSVRAALLLSNRLVPLDATPLTAREFWALVERHDPGVLVALDKAGIAERVGSGDDEATRLRTLLDAATALSFEEERLRDGGIALISALDDQFPARLRQRLGSSCPPFLLVAGNVEWLSRPSLGIVGSRDVGDEVLTVARKAAQLAVQHEWQVVSGQARGVDQASMAGALDAGGITIGVPAEGILRASRNADIRRRVHDGRLCLASPYPPMAPSSATSALGSNRIVNALSEVTFVVAADEDVGVTWSGAAEAIDRRSTPVAVWAGEGATDGNRAMIRRGAVPITALDQLLEVADLTDGVAPTS